MICQKSGLSTMEAKLDGITAMMPAMMIREAPSPHTVLGDEFADPHDQHGTSDERGHHDEEQGHRVLAHVLLHHLGSTPAIKTPE